MTTVELYDLSKDIHEDNNIATLHPEIIAEMEELMRKSRVDAEAFPFSLPVIR